MKTSDVVAWSRSFPLRLSLFPLCAFTFMTVLWMMFAFLPIHLHEMGIQDAKVGVVMGCYSISALLLMLPLGLLSDRRSPKQILLMGAFLFLVHLVGIQHAARWWFFVFFAALGGLCWSIFQIVLQALFLKVISPSHRGFKIAVFQVGSYLGFGVGPLLAGTVWGHMDYVRMLTYADLGAILLILLVLTLEDSEPIRFRWDDYRDDLKQPRALVFLLVWFAYSTHFGFEQTAYTLFMEKSLDFSPADVGWCFMAVGIWMSLLAPLTGKGFDARQSIVLLLAAGLLVSSLFQVATAFVETVPQMIGIRLLHTAGDVPVILSMGIMTAAFFPRGRLGGHSALVYAVRTIGAFLGNYGAGVISGRLGYGSAFIASGAVVFLATLMLLPAMRRTLVLVPR